jgi:tRNA G10  N-methylase Trm11
MYVALLGRQPALGIAELERVFGGPNISPFSDQACLIDSPTLSIQRLGGTLKAGTMVIDMPRGDWRSVSQKIVQHYLRTWGTFDGKITLGISAYGYGVSPRDIQKTGLVLKQKLKQSNISMRLIPNTDAALSTATSHHNKLGLADNKVELLVFRAKNGRVIVAESTGAQNITAYTKRDQQRPMRDAFVGMLPPKLAQIMINLAVSDTPQGLATRAADSESFTEQAVAPQGEPNATGERKLPVKSTVQKNDDEPALRVLDPFCGTGVILQEAALMGHAVYGTDLAEKMIRYSRDNLNWLAESHHITFDWYLHGGDAMDAKWQAPIGAVVAETYLGQPFSAPPSPAKLAEVQKNCNHIISTFLKNLWSQIEPGTPVCIAVPAWRDKTGGFSHLPLVETLGQLGYKPYEFHHVSKNDLLYFREDQVVARELLILTKAAL